MNMIQWKSQNTGYSWNGEMAEKICIFRGYYKHMFENESKKHSTSIYGNKISNYFLTN
jgi:hypothetical protein